MQLVNHNIIVYCDSYMLLFIEFDMFILEAKWNVCWINIATNGLAWIMHWSFFICFFSQGIQSYPTWSPTIQRTKLTSLKSPPLWTGSDKLLVTTWSWTRWRPQKSVLRDQWGGQNPRSRKLTKCWCSWALVITRCMHTMRKCRRTHQMTRNGSGTRYRFSKTCSAALDQPPRSCACWRTIIWTLGIYLLGRKWRIVGQKTKTRLLCVWMTLQKLLPSKLQLQLITKKRQDKFDIEDRIFLRRGIVYTKDLEKNKHLNNIRKAKTSTDNSVNIAPLPSHFVGRHTLLFSIHMYSPAPVYNTCIVPFSVLLSAERQEPGKGWPD